MKGKSCLFVCFILMFNIVMSINIFADDLYEDEPFVDIYTGDLSSASGKQPSNVEAGAAIVLDMKSGRILYEKNAYTRRAMASTTKIMTAIVAIENGDLDDVVTVSKRAASVAGSSIHLKEGQKLTLRELLYGMMLNSGNDAAIAVAEYIGGSVEDFAKLMTEKAKELGAKDTAFKTPHGLDAEGHYSTAYDMALITRYALNNTTFSKIVRTISTTISSGGLYNTNEMLGSYPGADGVKTGYTGKAGRCLVTSVTRNNWRIISVVLGCPTRNVRARTSKSILDYAFANYRQTTLLAAEAEVGKVPVHKGISREAAIKACGEVSLPLRQDEINAIETRIDLPDVLEAPVNAGNIVGEISYILNGKEIAQADLKTGADIRRKNFLDYLGNIIRSWSGMMSPNKAVSGMTN